MTIKDAIPVLLVDDCPVTCDLISMLLADTEVELVTCLDPKKALETALECKPAVILLDLVMPDLNGFEVLTQVREHPDLASVAVAVLSCQGIPEEKARAFETGANDYLVKTPHPVELLARIRYHAGVYGREVDLDQALEDINQLNHQLAQASAEAEN